MQVEIDLIFDQPLAAADGEERTVAECPYSPQGGCCRVPETPREMICCNPVCWQMGLDHQADIWRAAAYGYIV